MTDRYDDERRAMARCEADFLTEPAWRTGNPDACAAARDDDFSATPYATSPLPADDEDVIPIP